MASRRLLSTLAFLVFLLFLAVLVYRVPRIDLGIVIAVTLLLVAFDLWSQLWRRRSR